MTLQGRFADRHVYAGYAIRRAEVGWDGVLAACSALGPDLSSMFLENLEPREKRAFLGLAHKVVHADGVLEEREAQILATLSETIEEPALEGTVEELATEFQSRRSKVFALLELMGIGYVDGDYHVAEVESVAEIARALGFSDDELPGLESWVVRQLALLEEATGFWTAEDA